MNRSKGYRLNNVFFPIWMLLLFPLTWLVALPVNFLVDSAVVIIALKVMQQQNIKQLYKRCIIWVVIFGFVADIIGGGLMFLTALISSGASESNAVMQWFNNIVVDGVMTNPFSSIWSLLYVVICMAAASVLIYVFNRSISFKKLNIDAKTKHKLALSLAIITCPYLFLIPSTWIY